MREVKYSAMFAEKLDLLESGTQVQQLITQNRTDVLLFFKINSNYPKRSGSGILSSNIKIKTFHSFLLFHPGM